METSIDINNNKFTDGGVNGMYLGILKKIPFDIKEIYHGSGVSNIKEDYKCFIRFRITDFRK